MENTSLIEKIEAIKMPIRIAILAGTLIVFAVIFIFVVYNPKTEEISKVEDSIEKLEVKLTRAKVQRKKLPKVREEKKKVDLQFEAALKLLPDEKEISELVTQLTALAKESNLDMPTFKPQKNRVKGFYAEVPIQLKE